MAASRRFTRPIFLNIFRLMRVNSFWMNANERSSHPADSRSVFPTQEFILTHTRRAILWMKRLSLVMVPHTIIRLESITLTIWHTWLENINTCLTKRTWFSFCGQKDFGTFTCGNSIRASTSQREISSPFTRKLKSDLSGLDSIAIPIQPCAEGGAIPRLHHGSPAGTSITSSEISSLPEHSRSGEITPPIADFQAR